MSALCHKHCGIRITLVSESRLISMTTTLDRMAADGTGVWFGYDDFKIHSPDGKVVVLLSYAGEPPHGDSYHQILVNGTRVPGLAWAGTFAWSPCSRYFVVEWMKVKYERKIAVVDVYAERLFILPTRTPHRSRSQTCDTRRTPASPPILHL
jgi:hypothetical protein